VCLFLGDIVDYGGAPGPCVDWVRRNATLAIRGNHDHGAAQNVTIQGGVGFKYLSGVTRPLTRARLDAEALRFLGALPITQSLDLDGRRFLLVHGTPRDPLDEFAPPDADIWARRLAGVSADIVCVGHTHFQFALEVNGTLVVNPGSIGLQRDGDPRAGYAVLEDHRVEFRRVDYAIEEAVESIENTSLPDQAKTMLAAVYRTGMLPKDGNSH
jgi:putative phosphoesterase